MSAYNIVQKLPNLDNISIGGISTSVPIALKSGYLRILPEANAYIELGYSPGVSSTTSSLWVLGGTEVILKEIVRSQPAVGVQTGTTTDVIFAGGTGCSFNVGDYVELSGFLPVGINTNFAQVATVDTNTSYNGLHGTKMSIIWDTSSIVGVITNTSGNVRKTIKVAALNASSGLNTIHITEVQVVSNFS